MNIVSKLSKILRLILVKAYCGLPQYCLSPWAWMVFRILPHNPPEPFIHCIGDSHVSFFSGQDKMQPAWPKSSANLLPNFRVYRLGPVLAYNLCRLGTSTLGREHLFTLLFSNISYGSKVLLCFGEIDCRSQLVKRSILYHRSINDVVDECIDRYFSVILEIKRLGYNVIIWGVIPSTNLNLTDDPDYPSFGSCQERNQATFLFNQKLCKLAADNQVVFASIYDKLINSDGTTNNNYYMDKIHLSQKSMPLAQKEIEQVMNTSLKR